jgi:hypothetical protein
MTTYYVGGSHFFNTFSNLEAAIMRSEDGDVIELCKNTYGVCLHVEHNITLKGNGHFITPADGQTALVCDAPVTLDDIWFECKPQSCAIELSNGGTLTKITTRIKGPVQSFTPTLVQYGGSLILEGCDIMVMTAGSKDTAETITTDVTQSVLRDYYGGFAFIDNENSQSRFYGTTHVSNSFIMCSVFEGNTTISDTVLMNFNSLFGTANLISCTLHPQHGKVATGENEPIDGPLTKWIPQMPPFSLYIDGNVTVENHSSKTNSDCLGFLMGGGFLEIRNANVQNAQAKHLIDGGTVQFNNVTDDALYEFKAASYSQTNSNVQIHLNKEFAAN